MKNNPSVCYNCNQCCDEERCYCSSIEEQEKRNSELKSQVIPFVSGFLTGFIVLFLILVF